MENKIVSEGGGGWVLVFKNKLQLKSTFHPNLWKIRFVLFSNLSLQMSCQNEFLKKKEKQMSYCLNVSKQQENRLEIKQVFYKAKLPPTPSENKKSKQNF